MALEDPYPMPQLQYNPYLQTRHQKDKRHVVWTYRFEFVSLEARCPAVLEMHLQHHEHLEK